MDIEKEITEIKERNIRVEEDKAWEVSWTRRFFIMGVTYGVASVWLIVIANDKPFLNAFVPVAGYLLSTLSLPVIRKSWSKSRSN